MFSFLHFSLIDDLDLVSTSTSATILSERNTNQGSRFSLNPGLVSVSLTCSPACLSLFSSFLVMRFCFFALGGQTDKQTRGFTHCTVCTLSLAPPIPAPLIIFRFLSIFHLFILIFFFFFFLHFYFSCPISFLCPLLLFARCIIWRCFVVFPPKLVNTAYSIIHTASK